MLSLMRKKAGSWMIKILLGAVIVVFVFSYGVMRQKKKVAQIARVNGEPITLEEYRETYNSLIEQLHQRFGKSFNKDMIKMLGVKNQALNQLIDKRLLLAEASKLHFRVPNSELAAAIRRTEAFQTDGLFDTRRYQYVLKRNRLTPEEFEDIQRETMLTQKLKTFITGTVKVSDLEAREWYNWSNASVSIDFVLFEPSVYKDIKTTAKEIKAFFDNHKESYKTEPKIKANYLYFDPDAYKSKVKISDQEIQDYYQDNREEFKTPKTVEVRHILIQVDQNADPQDVKAAKIKAKGILKKIREGEDFAKLASKYSDCPSKDKGGYLGVFKKEDLVKPFAEKAFSMKAGEISEPVRTRFGWHIIKVEKVNEESTLPFNKAEKKIRPKLIAEKAKSLAYDEAEAVSENAFEEDNLVQIAKKRNLNILTTDFFTRQGPKKGILNRAKFASAAFNLPIMEISDILDLDGGYCIFQVTEKIPAQIPKFEDIKEKVRDDLIKEKQDKNARKDANEFLAALKKGESLSKECQKYNLTPLATGLFKRNASIPNIGFEQEITRVAFKLSKRKKIPDHVIKGEKGYYVIRFKERREPDPAGFEKEKKEIKERLLRQKQFKTFAAFLSQIRNKSEISIEDSFLDL